jgi:hypothetical protein
MAIAATDIKNAKSATHRSFSTIQRYNQENNATYEENAAVSTPLSDRKDDAAFLVATTFSLKRCQDPFFGSETEKVSGTNGTAAFKVVDRRAAGLARRVAALKMALEFEFLDDEVQLAWPTRPAWL